MLQIIKNGIELDIAPGTTINIERNNPMFLLDNIFGEYSTPITFLNTPKNIAAMGGFCFDTQRKNKTKFEIEVRDKGSFAFLATAVIDNSKTNRRYLEKGSITGFLLIGISKFYNQIKDKKANTLSLGGDRVFNFTSFDPDDLSTGYWQHFHATWDNTHDYIIAPVHNSYILGTDNIEAFGLYNGFMNQLGADGKLDNTPFVGVFPFPRVKYVIEQIFIENGWSIDTSELDGTDWQNLFLFNCVALEYYGFGPSLTFVPKTTLTINAGTWFSPELTQFDVLIELCRHYGWVPICGTNDNACKLIPLKKGTSGNVYDLTEYASTEVLNDFKADIKKYSFKNTFGGNDNAIASASTENYTIAPPVNSYDDLPTPDANYDTKLIFVYLENKYYKIELDEATVTRNWVVAFDNIYDEEVTESTETIDSKVTTFPIYFTKYRTSGGTDYYGHFPYSQQSKLNNWGLRTFYYHGMVIEKLDDGGDGTLYYPQLSPIRCLPDGTENALFSNVFRHADPNSGGADKGIINYWFKDWLNKISPAEINEQAIYLPMRLFKQLQWNDQILLFNVPYVFRSFTEIRPFKNVIQAKLQRILMGNVPTPGNPTGSNIYVRLRRTGGASYGSRTVGPTGIFNAVIEYTTAEFSDYIVEVFSDSTCTVPLVVASLTVIVRVSFHYDDMVMGGISSGPVTSTYDIPLTITAASSTTELSLDVLDSAEEYDYSSDLSAYDYVQTGLVNSRAIAPSLDYIVV
jgi:hypothetical protein